MTEMSILEERYQRWVVRIKHTERIQPYVNYIRNLFANEKRQYCLIKACGNAIETAFKVVQEAKEEIGNLRTVMSLHLQATEKDQKAKQR